MQEVESKKADVAIQSPGTPEVARKLPPWAIPVAVIAFVVFNALFLVFAMQMGTGTPE